MFAADDPAKALAQIRSYRDDGSMERAEVFASAFVDRALLDKKREEEDQSHLVEGARLLADILYRRGKYKRAKAAVSILHKERRKLGIVTGVKDPAIGDDHLLHGKILAGLGKSRAAAKCFSRVQKFNPGHLGAAIEACSGEKVSGSAIKVLETCIASAGEPVIANDVAVFQSANGTSCSAEQAITILESNNSKEANRLRNSLISLLHAEAERSARLAAAINSLAPTVDYHSYSRN